MAQTKDGGRGDYVTQHPPMEHPLETGYEPQLSYQGSTYTPKPPVSPSHYQSRWVLYIREGM